MTYWLQVVFKNNERPWSNPKYVLRGIENDDDAKRHAAGMQAQAEEYQMTLYRDGIHMPFEVRK